jgi:alpha-mannosidase
VPRTGAGAPRFALLADDGTVIPVQVLGRRVIQERIDADRHYPDQDEVEIVRVAFHARPVGGLAAQVLAATTAGTTRSPRHSSDGVSVGGRTLANEYVAVEVMDGGALALTDRRTNERYDHLLQLESALDAGDSYTWAPAKDDRPVRSSGPVRVNPVAAGPYVGVLEARWTLQAGRDPSGIGKGRVDARLVLRLHRGSPLVHYTLDLDNGGIDHRLRLRSETGLGARPVLTGTQFGVTLRAPVAIDARAHPRETPAATAPAHRIVAVAAEGRGLAVFSPGFFEIEWSARGELFVTVIRAVGQLSRSDLPNRPGHAGWPTATPLGQCLGSDRLELALAPVSELDLARADRLQALWEDAFLPVRPVWLRDAAAPLGSEDGITLEGKGLIVSAIKPPASGAGVVVRCYNGLNEPTSGRWRFGIPRSAAVRVRADEREPRPVPLIEGGRVLPFDAAPAEWVTHLVR